MLVTRKKLRRGHLLHQRYLEGGRKLRERNSGEKVTASALPSSGGGGSLRFDSNALVPHLSCSAAPAGLLITLTDVHEENRLQPRVTGQSADVRLMTVVLQLRPKRFQWVRNWRMYLFSYFFQLVYCFESVMALKKYPGKRYL